MLALKNLGPRSVAWLRAANITSAGELRKIGAVAAYLRVREAGFRPSANLLYALAGALAGVHWNRLPKAERSRLLLELDAAEQARRAHS